MKRYTASAAICALIFLSACTPIKEKDASEASLERALVTKPLPPEKAKEFLGETAEGWWYGQGVGETALTAGTIVLFPPYALLVLGNTVLGLSGYEQYHVDDLLPEEQKEQVDRVYDTVTSAPGQFNAAVAGKEFRTEERLESDLQKYLEPEQKVAQAGVTRAAGETQAKEQ